MVMSIADDIEANQHKLDDFEEWMNTSDEHEVASVIGQYAALIMQTRIDSNLDFGSFPDDLLTLQAALILGGPTDDQDYDLLYEVYTEILAPDS